MKFCVAKPRFCNLRVIRNCPEMLGLDFSDTRVERGRIPYAIALPHGGG